MNKKDENWIDKQFKKLPIKTSRLDKFKLKRYIGKRVGFGKQTSIKKKESKMDSLKQQIKLIPKFIALLILATGFIYSVRQVANEDPYLTGLGIITAMLLIKEVAES